jgi:hypothetical protein
VLISHYGCAFYTQILERDPDGCLPAQEEDLRTAAGTLRAWFPRVQVDGFMAMRDGGRLYFQPVPV